MKKDESTKKSDKQEKPTAEQLQRIIARNQREQRAIEYYIKAQELEYLTGIDLKAEFLKSETKSKLTENQNKLMEIQKETELLLKELEEVQR